MQGIDHSSGKGEPLPSHHGVQWWPPLLPAGGGKARQQSALSSMLP